MFAYAKATAGVYVSSYARPGVQPGLRAVCRGGLGVCAAETEMRQL